MEKRQTRIPRPAARPPTVDPLKVVEQALCKPSVPPERHEAQSQYICLSRVMC